MARDEARHGNLDQNNRLEALPGTQKAALEKLASIHKRVVFFGIPAIAALVLAVLGMVN